MEKVTLYTTSGFGNMVKVEARLKEHGTRKYAQYNSAPFVKYVKKRARKVTGFVQTFQPTLLIVAGWGHPEPDSMMVADKEPSDILGVTISRGRYTSFDPQWQKDFDSQFADYLGRDDVEVIADYRGHDSHNGHN